MPAAATARALEKPAPLPLTEQEAIRIFNSARFMVAQSRGPALKPGTIVCQSYEVWDGERSYAFPAQPIAIVREISRLEYIAALPPRMRGHPHPGRNVRYYEIHTD